MINDVSQQLGNYRLIHLLGQGGFAQVYLGRHIHLGTEAAIKVLTTRLTGSEVEQFHTEARIIARLKHPHIVRILDFGIAPDGKTPFFVMEYASHGTMRQQYPRGTHLTPAQIIPQVKLVAAALQHAHDRQLIHRDVKPENMLLEQDNNILLSDFGIAILAQKTQSLSTQEAIGTVPYMAPEQIKGRPHFASDQYALGIVVYEWLCGTRPFEGPAIEVAMQHISTPPPPLHERVSTISPEVEQVVLTALAKTPQERFASVQKFADALERATQPQELPSPPYSLQPSPKTVEVGTRLLPTEHQLTPTKEVLIPPTVSKSIPPLPLPPEQKKGGNLLGRLSKGRVGLLIGLAFLIVLGSVGAFNVMNRVSISTHPTPTVTAAATVDPTVTIAATADPTTATTTPAPTLNPCPASVQINSTPTPGAWKGWSVVPGGNITGGPLTATSYQGNLYLFGISFEGQSCFTTSADGNNWTGWDQIPAGGAIKVVGLSAVTYGTKLYLFRTTTDSSISYTTFDGTWSNSWMQVQGIRTQHAPTATVYNDKTLYLFGVDLSSSDINYTTFDGNAFKSSWQPIPLTNPNPPSCSHPKGGIYAVSDFSVAATSYRNELFVFTSWQGDNNLICFYPYNGNWGLSDAFTEKAQTPLAATSGPSTLFLFGIDKGTGRGYYVTCPASPDDCATRSAYGSHWQWGAGGITPCDITPGGETILDPMAVASNNSYFFLFARSRGQVYVYEGSTSASGC